MPHPVLSRHWWSVARCPRQLGRPDVLNDLAAGRPELQRLGVSLLLLVLTPLPFPPPDGNIGVPRRQDAPATQPARHAFLPAHPLPQLLQQQ
jgi:hypothetical protein